MVTPVARAQSDSQEVAITQRRGLIVHVRDMPSASTLRT